MARDSVYQSEPSGGAQTGVAAALVRTPVQRPPQLDRLEAFVGRWLTEGETAQHADAPSEQIVASDVYQWAAGKHFLVHPAYGRIGHVGVGGLEVIGYERETGQYRTHFFDSQGNESAGTLTFQDGTWTWQDEHTRCTGVFADGGRTLVARHERSDDGVHWEPSMTVTLRKIE